MIGKMVRRIRAGFITDPVTHVEHPIPGYTKHYRRQLARIGQDSADPDLTLTGTLLRHIAGRVLVPGVDRVLMIIRPYGRASAGLRAFAAGLRELRINGEYYWREGYTYTYTDRFGGRTLETRQMQVPGHWVRMPRDKNGNPKMWDPLLQRWLMAPSNQLAKRAQERPRISNADLATALSARLGYGRWAKGGKPPGSFISFSRYEMQQLSAVLHAGHVAEGQRVLRLVAGH
jgi:hypothetical protein